MLKKSMVSVLAIILMISLFAGCSNSNAGSVDAPVSKEITVVLAQVTNTLDAAIANYLDTGTIMNHVYDSLMKFDNEFNILPNVATSWEQIDITTYELTISDEFVFSNGEKLEVEDVVYSVMRKKDIPQLANDVKEIENFEAIDGNKVRLTLIEPNSQILRGLAGTHILNKSYCEAVGEIYANEPIGSGPYVVESYEPGAKVVLALRSDYTFTKPDIEKITFKAIAENASRFIALESGDADVAFGISHNDVKRAQDNESINLLTTEGTSTSFLAMNTTKAPFDDVRVRRAIAYACNKDGFVSLVGGSSPIYSMTPKILPTYHESESIPEYDLEKAKSLLAEAGYNENNPLHIEGWLYSSTPIAEALQADLKTIGVDLKLTTYEFGVFLQGVMNKEYGLCFGTWSNTTGSPLGAMANYWRGSFGSNNITFYENDRCDELYEQAKATVDETVVLAASREVQEIAAKDLPMIPIYTRLDYDAYKSNIEGLESHPGGYFNFKNAVIK